MQLSTARYSWCIATVKAHLAIAKDAAADGHRAQRKRVRQVLHRKYWLQTSRHCQLQASRHRRHQCGTNKPVQVTAWGHACTPSSWLREPAAGRLCTCTDVVQQLTPVWARSSVHAALPAAQRRCVHRRRLYAADHCSSGACCCWMRLTWCGNSSWNSCL